MLQNVLNLYQYYNYLLYTHHIHFVNSFYILMMIKKNTIFTTK